MAKIHKEITVKGKVQGVFFRASAKQMAEQLGIAGQVRNLPDGSVWIAAESEEPAMEAFIAWCRQGPPLARVAGVQLVDAPLQHYKTFEIERY
ncbi:acylphosphatase [Chitinophaga japonensis]|uniref:acylphosphatase n=1 Tax=Chitinophaga japonensis TaxID=104662 RepID=A0A562SUF4_CHIJA|nr:acylphosphatase [Chitinophaga japonensis]TWI84300.1 acylphosphatase [Chitinophaga japonensis]